MSALDKLGKVVSTAGAVASLLTVRLQWDEQRRLTELRALGIPWYSRARAEARKKRKAAKRAADDWGDFGGRR